MRYALKIEGDCVWKERANDRIGEEVLALGKAVLARGATCGLPDENYK